MTEDAAAGAVHKAFKHVMLSVIALASDASEASDLFAPDINKLRAHMHWWSTRDAWERLELFCQASALRDTLWEPPKVCIRKVGVSISWSDA